MWWELERDLRGEARRQVRDFERYAKNVHDENQRRQRRRTGTPLVLRVERPATWRLLFAGRLREQGLQLPDLGVRRRRRWPCWARPRRRRSSSCAHVHAGAHVHAAHRHVHGGELDGLDRLTPGLEPAGHLRDLLPGPS